MKLKDMPPGTAFQYLISDEPAKTLPTFIRLANGHILNLASGSIFTEMIGDDVAPIPLPETRGPVWAPKE